MADDVAHRRDWRLWLIPAAILIGGVALSVYVFLGTSAANDARVHNVLELRAQWRAYDYQNKLAAALSSVEGLADFAASQEDFLPVEFHRFARIARGSDPVARLAWAPWVNAGDRAAFVGAAQRNGAADFEIRQFQKGAEFGLVRAAPHESYAPVLYEESFGRRRSMLGLDILSDPSFGPYATRARDEGVPIATLPVPSATALDHAVNWTLIWPIYFGGTVPATLAERRADFLGFALGTMRPVDVMAFILAGTPRGIERLSIYIEPQQASQGDVPVVAYDAHSGKVAAGAAPLGPMERGGIRLVDTFSAYGEVWTLTSDFSPAAVRALGSSAPSVYLALGTLMTLLLAGYVGLELRRRRGVEAVVIERTHDLAATNAVLRHEVEAREIAQGELVRAGDQLRAMIDASPAGIVCVDPELRVLIWNKSAERIFGYRADEVVGRVNPLVPDEERDTFVDAFERVLQGRVLRGQVGHRKRKDGTVIVTSYSAAPFHDSSGAVQGAVYACEDATERNKLEAQLLRAQKLETVGQLTGGLAHDFNNILGAVIGNLDLLSEGVARDSALAGYCREALDAALSGAELVKRMLAFSRRQPLRPKPMDINDAIAGIRPLITRAIGERVKVETRLASDLWPATADPVQLESAVLNLAVNARDAMEEGGTIAIATANVKIDETFAGSGNDLEPGDYVVISVADTGTGIAPEVLAHAFEPFFTTKGPGKGSGLGLSMVFGTMKQLGGTARIYSELGVGTTVRLYLPRALSAAEVAAAVRDAPDDAAPRGTERILLVEDNAQIRSVGAGILEGLGYRVTVAESGDAALRRVEDGAAFDLLFTDVVMPGKLNGIGLARTLRARAPEIRILFTSGFTSPMTVRTEIDQLAAELLLKPYRRIDLARAVRQALDAKTKVGA